MKTLMAFFMTLLAVPASFAQGRTKADYGLPKLDEVREVTLMPSYSCRSVGEFGKGYQQTALFVSAFAKQRNNPDLLFNGACKSDDYFQAATAGRDISLIADLGGNMPLEKVQWNDAFFLGRTGESDPYASFRSNAKVLNGHTYAVVLAKQEFRGLFVFTVTDYSRNMRVTLRYAVKNYEVFPEHPEVAAR